MPQYPLHNLYVLYKERIVRAPFFEHLPDVTKKSTLTNINYALNLCEQWEHALDIGGSNGHYTAALVGKFKTATLVEVEPLPSHTTLPELYPSISVFQDYIEHYQSPKKADFILLADIFEHIRDIHSFTKQLATLQGPGGVVYIMTPNPVFCGPAPESSIYHTRHEHGHIKQYTIAEIERIMRAAGYEREIVFFEEAPLRQKVKRILFGLARRYRNWQHFPHLLARPFIALLYHLTAPLLERLVYRSEQANRTNPYVTITHDLVFKKPYEQA